MNPERSIKIGDKLIEEYWWHGKLVVYINHHLTEDTFEQAVNNAREK